MSFKGIVIRPGGVPILQDIDGHAGIKSVIPGWLEGMTITDDLGAYIDEEGKLKSLRKNHFATNLLYHLKAGLAQGDYIVGSILFFGVLNEAGARDSDEHDVPEWFKDFCKVS